MNKNNNYMSYKYRRKFYIDYLIKNIKILKNDNYFYNNYRISILSEICIGKYNEYMNLRKENNHFEYDSSILSVLNIEETCGDINLFVLRIIDNYNNNKEDYIKDLKEICKFYRGFYEFLEIDNLLFDINDYLTTSKEESNKPDIIELEIILTYYIETCIYKWYLFYKGYIGNNSDKFFLKKPILDFDEDWYEEVKDLDRDFYRYG